ncbi:MerR family transcriptional regulator [uncultured Ruthenibacterium sp.]|uniref:MerR family transcriptional regulator n=1 Tax=uncultured Ruthenibacterium sp. TaxID=1905347 RepID=UPI00349E6BA3
MEYSIHELSCLSGVSSRTLRWYDEIGLLKPVRVAHNGYRYYGPLEVNRLQDILYYRALGMGLSHIKECLDDPSFDRLAALRQHLASLQAQKERLESLIESVEQTIDCEERKKPMNDEEKFAAFKQKAIEKNEALYGKESRHKYGDAAVDASNANLMGLSQEQYNLWSEVDAELRQRLKIAVTSGLKPDADEGKAIYEMHRRWLKVTDPKLTAEKHKGIAQLYLLDERFTAYYDREVPGCAQFLTDAVDYWAK